MNRDERYTDWSQFLRFGLDDLQSRLWSALPGIIQSFDPDKMVCVVQPARQLQVPKPTPQDQDATSWIDMPQLGDVPVVFPRGGGFTLTFPLVKGDECLVVFSSRCIDEWWQNGTVGPDQVLRFHDLSDGFAIPGPSSQVRLLQPPPDGSNVQLRSDDGANYVEVTTSGVNVVGAETVSLQGVSQVSIDSEQVTVNATGSLDVSAPDVRITAAGAVQMDTPDLVVSGNVTASAGMTFEGKEW